MGKVFLFFSNTVEEFEPFIKTGTFYWPRSITTITKYQKEQNVDSIEENVGDTVYIIAGARVKSNIKDPVLKNRITGSPMITHKGTVEEVFDHPVMGYRYTHGRKPDQSFMLPFEFLEELFQLDEYLGKPFSEENKEELKLAIELGKIINSLLNTGDIQFKRAYYKNNGIFIQDDDSKSLFKLDSDLTEISFEEADVNDRLTYREMPSKQSLLRIVKECNKVGLVGFSLIQNLRTWRGKEFVKVSIEEEIFKEVDGRLQEGVSTRLILKEDDSDALITEIKRNIEVCSINAITRKEVLQLGFPKNQILYGPPGTGKTYNTVLYAVAICDNKSLESLENLPYEQVLNRYNDLKRDGRIAFTTFHQSYGYEEFIEGIKPVISRQDDNSTSDLKYEYTSGVFKNFCETAKNDQAFVVQPYVFIIDEINRGNISKIFGELITLIEPTKRIGELEAATAILPYTGDSFGVPNNVYILGTMNTADRSIALMDTALRRRFKFIEIMPDSNVLADIQVEGIDVAVMLESMNERIECLFDREHTIGHAYFTSLAEDPSIKNLAGIFLNAVIPLLQEYFYEDYSKIQLVLGDNAKADNSLKFILDTGIKVSKLFKGNPDIDLPEKKYAIQIDAFYRAESYIQIY
ncbi:McrB family protein [Neobacillus massiliamazoniensis]|uniref:ATPase dynein-related AAA domain-containing protein n=1 Tax=Neobacillus massiliamazoniensis TaxID=1499688 RepID=A0A0U1NYB2_9BACI|nr:AAA family ATPase [Neobacillus massiliamazoniensis]CRK83014.1 Hypothetical protein BN000_02969 [Neobacillus massiliamazoniensis]